MEPYATTFPVRELRALINRLIRDTRLEWIQTTKSADMPKRAYTATYDGTTYTVAESSKKIYLYRLKDGKESELVTSSNDGTVQAELTGLYRHARRSFDMWTSAEVNRYYRQELDNPVSIRDLFALVDHEKLAADFADEMTYIATNDGRLKETDAILSFHRREYVKALNAIKSIQKCAKKAESVLTVDDSDPTVLSWRAAISADFPAVRTDLHYRICPDYLTAGDDAQAVAVHFAALVVLLSLGERG